jgi:hypothetical protein
MICSMGFIGEMLFLLFHYSIISCCQGRHKMSKSAANVIIAIAHWNIFQLSLEKHQHIYCSTWPDFWYPDILPKDTLPKDTLPKDPLPNGHFAERTFCRTDILRNGHFAERTFCRTDILPNGHFADSHFAERTFCRTDILTNGQFAERTTCRK